MSRAAVRAIAQGDNVPPPVSEALRELADGVWRLETTLNAGRDETAVREPALRAAARATLVLEQTANLSVRAIVVLARATAVDLLRGSRFTPARGGRHLTRGFGRGAAADDRTRASAWSRKSAAHGPHCSCPWWLLHKVVCPRRLRRFRRGPELPGGRS